jgi:hypothetical protein
MSCHILVFTAAATAPEHGGASCYRVQVATYTLKLNVLCTEVLIAVQDPLRLLTVSREVRREKLTQLVP